MGNKVCASRRESFQINRQSIRANSQYEIYNGGVQSLIQTLNQGYLSDGQEYVPVFEDDGQISVVMFQQSQNQSQQQPEVNTISQFSQQGNEQTVQIRRFQNDFQFSTAIGSDEEEKKIYDNSSKISFNVEEQDGFLQAQKPQQQLIKKKKRIRIVQKQEEFKQEEEEQMEKIEGKQQQQQQKEENKNSNPRKKIKIIQSPNQPSTTDFPDQFQNHDLNQQNERNSVESKQQQQYPLRQEPPATSEISSMYTVSSFTISQAEEIPQLQKINEKINHLQQVITRLFQKKGYLENKYTSEQNELQRQKFFEKFQYEVVKRLEVYFYRLQNCQKEQQELHQLYSFYRVDQSQRQI